MIENYQSQIDKICHILSTSITLYSIKMTSFAEYNPEIVKSGIFMFDKTKIYIDTSSVEGINNLGVGEIISYKKRPSRANMQPIPNSVWFAKMKESNKIIIITENDNDILNNKILSTGFMGIKSSSSLPVSLLTAIIISKEFQIQRDLHSVGTTMAGVNNETFLEIQVPYLSSNQIESYDCKYKGLVLQLSILRKKINMLKETKSILLKKYF